MGWVGAVEMARGFVRSVRASTEWMAPVGMAEKGRFGRVEAVDGGFVW